MERDEWLRAEEMVQAILKDDSVAFSVAVHGLLTDIEVRVGEFGWHEGEDATRIIAKGVFAGISQKSERAYRQGKHDGFEEAYQLSDAEKAVAENLNKM